KIVRAQKQDNPSKFQKTAQRVNAIFVGFYLLAAIGFWVATAATNKQDGRDATAAQEVLTTSISTLFAMLASFGIFKIVDYQWHKEEEEQKGWVQGVRNYLLKPIHFIQSYFPNPVVLAPIVITQVKADISDESLGKSSAGFRLDLAAWILIGIALSADLA